ncbi:MAG: glycosyltransferase [Bacteroidetes bacterium]|nr:MAG: glycosyltransferase [Bacteroidota bacterium]
MALTMLMSFPEIMSKAKQAKKELKKIIKKYSIHAVISDNRYELSTSEVPSIFITHQLNIQTNGWQVVVKPIIDWIINSYINKFDEVWVPDVTAGFQLSGKLSNSNKFLSKRFYIGLLSRFSKADNNSKPKNFDLLIILSGPEPQRTILEKMLLAQALETNLKIVMLLGKPDENINKEINNVKLISHLPDAQFASLIRSAKFVISRPGYSTMMDLANFGNKAAFIPTPGQTEQEYLANRLLEKGIAFSQSQSSFNLSKAIANQNKYTGLIMENNTELLKSRIDNLLI